MRNTAQAGDLLIANPTIKDHRFNKSVILLTDHDDRGSVGLVLNRTTEYRVNDLITPLNVELTWDPHLYWGGPVCQDISFMLHSPEWSMGEYTRSVDRNWSVTNHWSMFVHLSDSDEPQHWRVFAGCCAWSVGQLARELHSSDSAWLVLENPPVDQLLEIQTGQQWTWAVDQLAARAVVTWMA